MGLLTQSKIRYSYSSSEVSSETTGAAGATGATTGAGFAFGIVATVSATSSRLWCDAYPGSVVSFPLLKATVPATCSMYGKIFS
jgi:hypothetical protein